MESIDTSCGKCIFAEYNDDNEQVSCKVGRLKKFIEQGAILDFERKDGKTYSIIKNRICLMCCTEKTVDKLVLKKPAQEMRERISLKCAVYVIADEESDLEKLKNTIKSLSSQKHQAASVNIILKNDNIGRPELTSYLKNNLKKDFNWNIIHIHESASREWYLDHAIAKCTEQFYSVFIAGFYVPEDYLSSIDKALNDDLERFSTLLPADNYWNGAFVQTSLHNSKIFQGNTPMKLEYKHGTLIAYTIMDKIEYAAKQEKVEYMVRKVEDICPSMKA